jgi:hypothetical protein
VVAAAGGSARVGLVARSLEDPRRACLLEGRASLPDQEPLGLATCASALLPCPAKAARVAYLAHRDGRFFRAWVVEGEDGKLYAPAGRGSARLVRERAELARSALVVLPAGRFLLVAPPSGGLRLEPF